MDKLINMSCEDFTKALASKSSVPGGGGVAALAGALAVALGSMVGNFTLGKKKYAEYESDIARILEKAEKLREKLLSGIDKDAEAFYPLSEAYAIPKDDPKRAELLEKATTAACEPPLETARLCCGAVELLEELLQKGSVMLISDVGCGALLASAALQSAAMNVFINTKALADREKANSIERELDGILSVYLPRAKAVSDEVSQRIRGRE